MQKKIEDLRKNATNTKWDFLSGIAKETGYSIDAKANKKLYTKQTQKKKSRLRLGLKIQKNINLSNAM